MKKQILVSVLGTGIFIYGCTGQKGPAGPAGITGAPSPLTFQTSFQNGVYPNSSYSGELDTWLNGGSGSAMNASPYLEVNTGSGSGAYGRILTKFDVSFLPTNITVISAQLWLKLESATNVGSSPVTIGLHNLAVSTFSACHWLSNATWVSDGSGGWNLCTGDGSSGQEGYINPTTMSTVVLSSAVNGTSSFYKWNIDPSVVQSWLTSVVNNNGLILKSEGEFGEGTSSVGFYPYNDATAANHAVLIVTYQ